MSMQEDFHRPEKPLENTLEISQEVEMKRKFNRNQKCITPWDIQLGSLLIANFQMNIVYRCKIKKRKKRFIHEYLYSFHFYCY